MKSRSAHTTTMGLRLPPMSRRQQLFILLALSVFLLLFLARPMRLSSSDIFKLVGSEHINTTAIPTPESHTAQSKSSVPTLGPPTYEKLRQWEHDLPQHNLSLPYPEGRNGRYVKFTNQIKMLGWNNVLNEVLMNAHLAYESQRAYVFQDYVWKPDYYPWPESQFPQNPPHTPLNALISGPTAGGPWDPTDTSPRAISSHWFDTVCPPSSRHIINTRAVKPALRDAPGDTVFAHWRTLLHDAPEPCIEITADPEDSFPQTFDLWLWGTTRVLPLWETFSKSPTSRLLGTSPIVQSAVARNAYLFLPRGPRPPFPAPKDPYAQGSPRDPYARMMAMHVRRGDFKEACVRLARYESTFYSWNLLPELPDAFVLPPGVGYNTTVYLAAYMGRCLPELEGIVGKARESREDWVEGGNEGGRLDVMYLLTNERGEWLGRLKAALRRDGWYTVVTSGDLELDAEQMDVGMAVDMDIARRAAVFVGNGWSSFTSNIVHRRLVDGKDAKSIRFW